MNNSTLKIVAEQLGNIEVLSFLPRGKGRCEAQFVVPSAGTTNRFVSVLCCQTLEGCFYLVNTFGHITIFKRFLLAD